MNYSAVKLGFESIINFSWSINTWGLEAKDDSVFKGPNWDLIGDQLVPVTEWGNYYAAQLGWAHILSSDDNNEIIFGDSTFILQKNQFAFLEFH